MHRGAEHRLKRSARARGAPAPIAAGINVEVGTIIVEPPMRDRFIC